MSSSYSKPGKDTLVINIRYHETVTDKSDFLFKFA